MKGLEAEFSRFQQQCLEDATPEEVESARATFFCGGLAATQRFLSIVEANLPISRKQALVRRLVREMEAFQSSVTDAAQAEQSKEGKQ